MRTILGTSGNSDNPDVPKHHQTKVYPSLADEAWWALQTAPLAELRGEVHPAPFFCMTCGREMDARIWMRRADGRDRCYTCRLNELERGGR